MKKISAALLAVALVAVFTASVVQAQELVYDQRENQVSYNGTVGNPALVFNGVDYAVFYSWSGIEDAGSGLYMRRLGRDGKPLGPQRQLQALDNSYAGSAAVWDGSAYIVFTPGQNNKSWHVFRVDPKGEVLGHRSVANPEAKYTYILAKLFSFVIGERVFLFFTSWNETVGSAAYLVSVDSKLKTKPSVSYLPSAGMESTRLMGVTHDTEKFLLLLARIPENKNEIDEAALLHLDFNGELIKTIRPSGFAPDGAGPAERVKTVDLRDVAGPLNVGDGYFLFGIRAINVGGTSYPYIVTSLKIDETGEILQGPFKVEDGPSFYWTGIPALFGRNVALPLSNAHTGIMGMNLFGVRGKHITSVILHETSFSPPAEAVSSVYSGDGLTSAYLSSKYQNTNAGGTAIFSNVITDVSSAKPEIVYFQASSKKAFGDTRRLVMWSISSGTKVSLTGPKLKLKNLPPVFHTVVDTKGKKTKLRLRYTGTDGKNKKSKLVIKP